MEAKIQLWNDGRGSDDMFRFMLGKQERNSKIIKRNGDTARQSRPESMQTQATNRCKKKRKSSCMLQHWERLIHKQLCRC